MWPVLLVCGKYRVAVYASSVNQSLSIVVTSLINVLLLVSTTTVVKNAFLKDQSTFMEHDPLGLSVEHD